MRAKTNTHKICVQPLVIAIQYNIVVVRFTIRCWCRFSANRAKKREIAKNNSTFSANCEISQILVCVAFALLLNLWWQWKITTICGLTLFSAHIFNWHNQKSQPSSSSLDWPTMVVIIIDITIEYYWRSALFDQQAELICERHEWMNVLLYIHRLYIHIVRVSRSRELAIGDNNIT